MPKNSHRKQPGILILTCCCRVLAPSDGEKSKTRKDRSANILLDFILVPESPVLLQAELNGAGSLQVLKQQKILGA